MLDRELVIVIPGHPAPKGSLKCVGGRGARHQLVEDNKRSKDWRDRIALEIRRKWPTDAHAEQRQPIGAEITFTLERPDYHYGTGRNAGVIKPRHVDAYPVGHGTGDVDKLLRLVLDAIQDTSVLPDDSAVVEVLTRKAYVGSGGYVLGAADVLEHAGVVIRLYPIGEPNHD